MSPPPAELLNNALAEASVTVGAVTDTTSTTTTTTTTNKVDGNSSANGTSSTNTIIDPTVTAASEANPASQPKWRPLTVQGVAERRARAGKMVAGVAAPTNVPLYKGYYANDGEDVGYKAKPWARRWDHKLSREALIRKGNSLKKAAKYLGKPGLISLGGGLPSDQYFPFAEMQLKVPPVGGPFTAATTSALEPNGSGKDADLSVLVSGKHDLPQGKSLFDISTAFNYGQGSGAAQLLRFVTEHTEIVHAPPYQDWSCTLSIGSTSALDMALRMLTRPGDAILSEEYTFSAAVETAMPMGVSVVGVAMDGEGLVPEAMDEMLSDWDPQERRAGKPSVLYTVPTGQNPTGATQGRERRKKVYEVAQRHDLMIIEDEPYYFLQMEEYRSDQISNSDGDCTTAKLDDERNGSNGIPSQSTSSDSKYSTFLSSLLPSLLSLDTDGRVLRLDSFSKVLAPGARVGWVTAPEQLTSTYTRHADVSTQCPSGMSQLILFKLLEEHWGHAGYLDWLMYLRKSYTERRNGMVRACELKLPREVVSWEVPRAGMFHWLRINYRLHPAFSPSTTTNNNNNIINNDDNNISSNDNNNKAKTPSSPPPSLLSLEERLFLRSIDHGALVMRGSYFCAQPELAYSQQANNITSNSSGDRDRDRNRDRNGVDGNGGGGGGVDGDADGDLSMFFRATYASAPFDMILEGIGRFGDAVREEFGLG